MEARLNTALAPTLPVVFRYNGITKTFSDPPAQGGDAQALGVWKTNDNPPKAWKIYKNLNLQNRITAWYQTAYDQKLPVGGTPAYYQGTYTEGAGAQINGWALVVNWQVGSQFNFQGTKPFGSALRDQQISHSKTSSQYL
ncbi:hypothetical protein APHAL10511_000283 [Amanita phalloides]|nr:hypothetical protein APHAL10511_000283 [Amanita phalloides]